MAPTAAGIGGPLIPSGPDGMGYEQTFFRESPVHWSPMNGVHSDFYLMQDRPGRRAEVLEKLVHMPFSGQTTLNMFDHDLR